MNVLYTNSLAIRIAAIIFAFFLQAVIYQQVVLRSVDTFSLIFWVASIISLYVGISLHIEPFQEQQKNLKLKEKLTDIVLPLIVILIGFIIRVVLSRNTYSFHIDEYLTAHFSYSLPRFSEIDWFGVYPPVGVWICQFPIPYFFIQKLFFNILGLSSEAMRISVMPYALGVLVFTYLFAKVAFGKNIAFISVLLLAVFSPDLYLNRWSLHFISSTFIFLVAAYLFVLAMKYSKKIHFGLFGFALGLCYFTYYSSYVALPVFLLAIIFALILRKINSSVVKGFAASLVVFAFTIAPLIFYAAKVDNFFTQRTAQVKLIGGLWSPYKDTEPTLENISDVLKKQIIISTESLYKDDIGGHAGYWFGRNALLDKTTFVVLVGSLIFLIFRIIIRKDVFGFIVLTTIVSAFVSGMVLTIPPPAYHRMSLAFPFIAILMAASIYYLYQFVLSQKKKIALPFLLFILGGLIISNLVHFRRILYEEGPDDPEFTQIERTLMEEGANFAYIAAFDSYALGKVLYVRSNQKIDSKTMPFNKIREIIPGDKTSYLVLLYPDDELFETVSENFPGSSVIGRYERHAVLKIK